MTQLKSPPSPDPQQSLSEQVLQETLKIEAQTTGVLENFVTVVSGKAVDLYHNIMGDYGYTPKNQFSFNQKHKILSYLESKMFTDNIRLQQVQKIKFADYDQHFLDVLPDNIDALRNKILKARTNLDAAEKSYESLHHSRDQMTVKYLNQQAYQFDKVKYNSMAWGFVFAAFINCTLYKHGSTIRKAALFATFGHVFGIISYMKNVNRYFDSVYPIFEKDALIYSTQQKIAFKNWKPQGQAIIEN